MLFFELENLYIIALVLYLMMISVKNHEFAAFMGQGDIFKSIC
jgi:hypothetical protein